MIIDHSHVDVMESVQVWQVSWLQVKVLRGLYNILCDA